MGKKSSKCCCIYKKPHVFDESDSSESDFALFNNEYEPTPLSKDVSQNNSGGGGSVGGAKKQ
jgi:hypothetical protein